MRVLAVDSLSFAVGGGASFSFDLASQVEIFFDVGATLVLASVPARVRFDRAMMICNVRQVCRRRNMI